MSLVPKNGKVAVIGAGISGLSYSYFLSKLRPDLHISIFESGAQPGGWIKTEALYDNGHKVLLEKGPRTLRGVSDGTLLIVDMMKQLGLQNEVEVMKSSSLANRKWLLDPTNKLVQVPNSFPSFVKFISSGIPSGLARGILGEPFRKKTTSDKDESVRSFIERRFGSPALADNVLSAIMHGIYSGDVSRLSAKATLPSLLEYEREYGSIIKAIWSKMTGKNKKEKEGINEALLEYERDISPGADLSNLSKSLKQYPILRLHSGLQVLPLALANYLIQQKNVDIFYNTQIDKLKIDSCEIDVQGSRTVFDYVRYTADAKGFGKITDVTDADAKTAIESFEYTTIFLANVYSKTVRLVPPKHEGFGFLVPKRNTNHQALLGVIYDSDTERDAQKFFGGKSIENLPYHKITLMMGGHYYNSGRIPSSGINVKIVKEILCDILEVDLEKHNVVVRNEADLHSKDIALGDNDILISYNLHENCIPQYNVGFLDSVNTMLKYVQRVSGGKVSIGGTSLGKLGVPDCVMNSLDDAMLLRLD
ncbi:protoporphyrinogen oxidase [Clavispora lusitaniae]|uniref:Protoporphyrinogen oxidase n=1 Tax=Clavispora lusitaniae (strain ATCC 42720) TaxID=306902 RepID=C4Y6R9_CLAL4|nr:uncharacterized protein CLUG_03853 [Clavispora lusitaniae ATCC 42720]EEQ39725.1 hypothetical protein CLUG_03853 [Clavispora lusitaniae ATCC 42720]KAF7582302.1 protoporphyrinogen oxidase [Clavispora lusitaniae]